MYLTKSLTKVAGMEPLVLDLALDLVLWPELMRHTLVLLAISGVCVEAKFHPFEVVLDMLELLEVADASSPLLLEVLVVFGVLQLSPQPPRALQWLPLDVNQDLVHHNTAPTMPLQPCHCLCNFLLPKIQRHMLLFWCTWSPIWSR